MTMRSLFRPFAVSLMAVNHAPPFISSSASIWAELNRVDLIFKAHPSLNQASQSVVHIRANMRSVRSKDLRVNCSETQIVSELSSVRPTPSAAALQLACRASLTAGSPSAAFLKPLSCLSWVFVRVKLCHPMQVDTIPISTGKRPESGRNI